MIQTGAARMPITTLRHPEAGLLLGRVIHWPAVNLVQVSKRLLPAGVRYPAAGGALAVKAPVAARVVHPGGGDITNYVPGS